MGLHFSRSPAAMAALVIALAGCPGPMMGPGFANLGSRATNSIARSAQRLATSRLLYVADDTDVSVYPADKTNPPPIRTITDGINQPEGLAVDGNGVLYVANSGGNTVSEYRAGETHPFKTISDGLDDPQGLTVDSQGTIYVGNRNLGTHQVYVTVYAHNSMTPTLTITFPPHNLPQIGGLAVDGALNLYVLTVLATATVTKFPPGSSQGIDLGLQGIGPTGDGVAVDAANNLYVAISTGAINVYAPGTMKAERTISKGVTSPAFFVVDAAGALFVPNQVPGGGSVLEFLPNRNRAKFTIGGFAYPKGTAVTHR